MEVISQDEIDEILENIEENQNSDIFKSPKGYENKKIKIYDFLKPQLFSAEIRRVLSILHERFSKDVEEKVQKLIGENFSLDVSSIHEAPYYFLPQNIKMPTHVIYLKVGYFGVLTLEINPVIVNEFPFNSHKLLEILEKSFEKLWKNIVPSVEVKIDSIKSSFNTYLCSGILITMDCIVRNSAAQMNIFVPESLIKYFKNKFVYDTVFPYEIHKTNNFDLEKMFLELKYRIYNKTVTKKFIESLTINSILNINKTYSIIADNTNLFEVDYKTNKIIEINNVKEENYMDSKLNFLSTVSLEDVNIQLSVELGRTKKTIKEVLSMGEGTIVELDSLAGEPVNVYANNVLIAKGEVVVIDENFGVRIVEICNQVKLPN